MGAACLSYYFEICATETYQAKYLDYLLGHYADLGLPYPFTVALSYIASPVLIGNEAILAFNADDELVGAVGYIHGTGDHDYADTEIVQIQIVYIDETCRCTRLFLRGLQFLAQHLRDLDQHVAEIRFWTAASSTHRSLFGKLAERASVTNHPAYGQLDEYRVSLPALLAFTGMDDRGRTD